MYIENEDVAKEKLVNAQLKQIGDDINAASAGEVAEARELSADEYDQIVSPQNVISENDKAAITKYQFRRFYNFYKEITPGCILLYGKSRLKCQYLRRKRLQGFQGDAEVGIRGLINSAIVANNIAGVDVERIQGVFDINRDKIAIELMSIFGQPFDSTYVLSREDLVAKLHVVHEKLTRECKFVCKIFGVKAVTLPKIDATDYVKKMLDYINGKLDVQYGVKVKATDSNRIRYQLYDSFANLFDGDLNIK